MNFFPGYLHYYPWVEDKLRLRSVNSLYPPNLYKGIIFSPEGHNGGNNKMLYIGTQDQYYTYTMFDVEVLWIYQQNKGVTAYRIRTNIMPLLIRTPS